MIERAREARSFADQIERLIAAQIPERVSERDGLRRQISNLSNVLAGLDFDALSIVALGTPKVTIKEFQESATTKRTELEANLRSARAELTGLQTVRERSINLAEELRQVAIQFLNVSRDDTECPLCHTRFNPGELLTHITKDIDSGLDRSHQNLLARLRQFEEAYGAVVADEAAATALVSFCVRTNLSLETPLDRIIQLVNRARDELSSNTSQLKVVEQILAGLKAQGLSWEDLEPAKIELVKRRFPQRVRHALRLTSNCNCESHFKF
jgi:exonuclease SbcC